MANTSPEGNPEENPDSRPNANDEIAQLRAILIGPEREQLDRLRQRLDTFELRSEDVGDALPDAVSHSAATGKRLRNNLQPIIEEAIHISIRKDPEVLADALYPTIASAIRKAVSAALASMTQSLNAATEKSLSRRSLQWRLEALRTGKSFGEIALLRSQLYRVEQVFLIHRDTGLLLHHEAVPAAVVKDTDLVSGMLTAIRDFVQDSFGGKEQELERVQVGEYLVWIQQGPKAVLAAVIRGTPPGELQGILQRTLEEIHRKMRLELEAFNGEASAFRECRPGLKACLQGRAAEKPKSGSFRLWLVPAIAVLAVVLFAIVQVRDQRRLEAFTARLEAEPGIVVTSAERNSGRITVAGLKDPLAADPAALLEGTGIRPEKVDFRWSPYQSPHTPFAARRDLRDRIRRVGRHRIRFATNSSEVGRDNILAVENAFADLEELFRAADRAGKEAVVEILGSADSQGAQDHNLDLARRRALGVQSVLVALGLSDNRLRVPAEVHGQVSHQGDAIWDAAYSRSVSFRAVVNEP